jgi:CheY-like chemotaxis protein
MFLLRCILLVDDDPTTNYLNQKLLTKMGVADQVLTALNGQEALAAVHTHCPADNALCPNLVFLDVNMPLMNGFEFLAAYRQLPLAQQLATVVMLTSSLHPRDVARPTPTRCWFSHQAPHGRQGHPNHPDAFCRRSYAARAGGGCRIWLIRPTQAEVVTFMMATLVAIKYSFHFVPSFT